MAKIVERTVSAERVEDVINVFGSFDENIKITDAFLSAEFLGGRHQRRVDMLEQI